MKARVLAVVRRETYPVRASNSTVGRPFSRGNGPICGIRRSPHKTRRASVVVDVHGPYWFPATVYFPKSCAPGGLMAISGSSSPFTT